MSTYTTTVNRRSAKTKQQQQQQQQQQKHAETLMENQNASSSNEQQQNERLHGRSISDKPLALPQRSRSTTSTTSTQSTRPALCCNGATAVCCRDINCHLNAPLMNALRGSVERRPDSRQSTATTKTTTLSTSASAREHSRSPSLCSRSRSTTPSRSRLGNGSVCHNQAVEEEEEEEYEAAAAAADDDQSDDEQNYIERERTVPFTVNLSIDLCSWLLFVFAFATRFYKLSTPSHVVFDELHYGKFVSHYMRHVFFFDQHPPLGKQMIATVVGLTGYDGNFTFSRIGSAYGNNVPIFWMRFVPALCGSLLAPAVYRLLLEAQLRRWSALLGGLLIVLDNALLTQSRFVLMESMLLLASTIGICCLLRFQKSPLGSIRWLGYGASAAFCLACAACIKYVGFLALALAIYLMCRHLWQLLYDVRVTIMQLVMHTMSRLLLFFGLPLVVYIGVFYLHLATLHRAGPHDSIMTSAFQASLDGGLASITRGQPLDVVHGSQITLRHTHGRTCWLHSHAHVYPVRYKDKRGSSHQQQVTCYSFKDVNNWWIVKRPQVDNLVVGNELDPIRHGDVIQLVHGITSRALNSHDVAAPMTPQCQEVSCYIDYEIKMEGELLWRVDILNRRSDDEIWHTIKSEIRLIHETTGAALRFTGRQLPDWGFNQHEVVADREPEHQDAIWNVEEHRYTKTQDQRERERQLLTAEMIPTKRTRLSFWAKLVELQAKMLWQTQQQQQSHMYSSQPHEWPLLDKGIAYWLDGNSSAQIYLLGNILIWYTATGGILIYALLLAFYAVRRQRLCFDLSPREWRQFVAAGDTFFIGYLLHYLPYYFVDRTLFLHHYLPAFLYKLLLLCFVVQHIDYLIRRFCKQRSYLVKGYRLILFIWLIAVIAVFIKFLPLSYGGKAMSVKEINALRWKDTWDFIVQRNPKLK